MPRNRWMKHPHSAAWMSRQGLGWCVAYNATTTSAVISDGAAIQDLHDDAMTLEAWIRSDGSPESNSGYVLQKGTAGSDGWIIYVNNVGAVIVLVYAGVDGYTVSANGVLTNEQWHHIAAFYDDAGDRKVYIAIDGTWLGSYTTQIAATNVISSDVGDDIYIGNRSDGARTFDGAIGWCRISNNDRYSHTTNFTPQSKPPSIDGNTIVQYNFDEGGGTALDNDEGTAAYDATLSNGTWEKTFPL